MKIFIASIVFKILYWVDNEINHGILENILLSGSGDEDTLWNKITFWLWKRTSYVFCYWVHVTLYNKFIEKGIDADQWGL